ncbi:hypothetical protein [Methylobacterium sp. CM6244]
MIHLGQTVREVITSFEGVVTSRHEYLHGCTRITVQSRELKDGKPIDSETFDEQQLVVLDVPNVLDITPRTNAPGGERPIPPRPAVPGY